MTVLSTRLQNSLSAALERNDGGSPTSQHTVNDRRRAVGVFVRPEAQDRPTRGPQRISLFPITSDVAVELRRPVIPVDTRSATVIRTAVPEAAINEDRDLSLREYNVRTNEPPLDAYRVILSETMTKTVQGSA